MGNKKYYVVWDGITPGVYASWKECEKQIKGYPNAKYKSFVSEEEAQTAYTSNCWEYIGKNAIHPTKATSWRSLPPTEQPLRPSVAVDAACSGNPGKMEYQGVDTETGQRIFHFGPLEDGTNNIGEFLAIVHALAHFSKYKECEHLPIYSDSRTAHAWVKKKKAATKLEHTDKNARIFELIHRAEAWLQTHNYSNPILKWDTDKWGEIPADFGRK